MKGFTLLELLVVLAITIIASSGVIIAFQNNHHQQLTKEANRLIALLEAARAEARISGSQTLWTTTNNGFHFISNQNSKITNTSIFKQWLTPGVSAFIDTNSTHKSSYIILGPEPIIPPQKITLTLGQTSLDIKTNGATPFATVIMNSHSPQ